MAYTLPGGGAANFKTATPGVGVQTAGALNLVFASATGYLPPTGQAVTFQHPTGYLSPAGSAADFSLAGIPPVTGVGAVTIPITATGTGTHSPPVSHVTIAVTASGTGAHYPRVVGRVRSGASGSWVKATQTVVDVFSPQPATKLENQQRAARWGRAQEVNAAGGSAWSPSARTDASREAAFGAFGEMLNEAHGSAWLAAKSVDDRRRAQWGAFGEMLNEARGSNWFSAKPIDHSKLSAWTDHLIASRRIVPYDRPMGSAANFTVVGGGVIFWLDATTGYVPPGPNNATFSFGADAYVPPRVTYPELAYAVPNGRAANFLYNPTYVPLLDHLGSPVVDIPTRDTHAVAPWGLSRRRDREQYAPWTKYSRPLNPGWGVVVPGGGVVVPPGESVIIPVKRVYIVLNEILFMRADDSTPIVASNINISFDRDSWLPTFSATIPESARDAVMPDPSPVEVYAYINGSEFRFFVERIGRSRQFAQRTVTISGRGIACELDAPFAVASQHTNATDMTAQQIIDAALGFSTYTQTWNITDWLVPANTFSMFGTPAAVAGEVAEASGSVLQADWALRDLRMLPRYAVKPWDWAGATPDYVIPAAVAQTESLEWIEKPDYNVVYVSGIQSGVIGQVKKTGSAGDKPAAMYTNQLITHADAARQKGIAILGDTGRKALLQISMPVLPETGVIDVCKLIEFSDGANTRRGVVSANSVSVNWPTVRQTLTIEAAA